MNLEIIKILQKSGDINNKTQKYAKKIIKPGVSIYEIGTKIDKFIIEQGAFPAWPVNLSINYQAAHSSYNKDNDFKLDENDVLKVDVGVSINGYITDSSQTIVFNKEHEKLRECSFKALECSKTFLKENYKTARISEVGEIIENKIKSYGYKPISNLTGHYIDRYKAHDSPSIPNILTDICNKFTEFDKAFAIEPFASTGNGFVGEGDQIHIFEFVEEKAIRNSDARQIITEIKKFNGMPFSEYWVGENLSEFNRKIALRELLRSEIISGYPVLIDKKGCFVSQWENTFLIDSKEGLLDLVNIDELF
jgi:methionyl aminopeptidase